MDTNPSSGTQVAGNGGFMDPEIIARGFGVSEGMKVADFGCGSGYFTIILGKLVGESGKISAVDVMNIPLETVRAKANVEGLKNIETIRGNLEVPGSSGLGNESQDMVLLANILFQSQQKQEIIKEAKRTLRQGGKLVIIDWKKGTGGFGPPDDLRTDPEVMRQMVLQIGFQFVSEVNAGTFHFGETFTKI